MASCETLEEQNPSDPPPSLSQQPPHSEKTLIQEPEKEEQNCNPPIEQPPLLSETTIDNDEEQNPNNSMQQSDKEDEEEEEEDDDVDNDNDDSSLLILDQKSSPMTSPTSCRSPTARANNNLKKGSKKKKKKGKNMKKVQKILNLTDSLKPIPFINKKLDLAKYEGVLKKSGLYDFTQIDFDPVIQTHLIAQLIVNYDPKKRCSIVNDYKIKVNRPDLARALKLPLAKQVDNKPHLVDLDSDHFSEDDIGFLENFVMNWILLGEEQWETPTEISNWTRCIRDGHPEKLDSASLIWYKVEKELTQGDKLVDCYYASHLQYLMKSQREKLFDDVVNLEPRQEHEQLHPHHNVDLTLGQQDVEEIVDEEVVKEDAQEVVDAQAFKVVEEVPYVEEIVEEVKEDYREIVDAQAFKVVEEVPDVEEIVEEEVVKEDDQEMVDAQEDFKVVEEVPAVEEHGNWEFGGNKMLGDHYLQRCRNSDLNNFEETKVEDEQIEQVDEEEEVGFRVDEDDEDVGVSVDEGFDMEANDDSLEDRDGLTGNYLQGVETSHAPFNSHGISSMDLFGSRDASFLSHDAGPSFFNNGGKRAMEPEEDMHHLDGNNKRLKTDTMLWDQKPNDFGFCLEQMQQWMEKAKIIYESKEQSYADSQYDQQVTVNDMQARQNYLEMVIKSRDEELQRKNNEVFRLERELFLMGDLVQGYRKALNDTRLKFSDYRKRYALKEEPLYKDAGPGGLVLSTRELEKRRLKQEEDREKFISLAKTLEDEFLNVFEKHHADVLMMVDKLVCVEDELKRIKELFNLRKETQASRDEQRLLAKTEENHKSTDKHELNLEPEENQKSVDEHVLTPEPEENQKSVDEHVLTPEPEENQKSVDEHVLTPEPEENQKSVDEQGLTAGLEGNQKSEDEILENDASMESVPPEADDSKEKEGDGDS